LPFVGAAPCGRPAFDVIHTARGKVNGRAATWGRPYKASLEGYLVPVDRPTFSESWYRVANLRPRLRATVQAHRQHFRGRMWHVLQDPANTEFFRVNSAAYHFIAMLDGHRTVAQVWQACNEQLGDSAPTQGEAIQLLGRLYGSNLLQAELTPDTESLFKRFQKRRTREVQSFLMNLLFVRIPLLDPDRFLDRWLGVFGRLFSWYGFILWLGLLAVGFYFLAGRWDELSKGASNVLSTDNLPYLYLGFALVKVFHEFGHAFACKKFGRQAGTSGEVHVMGIMFLVFTPMPYVDASTTWTLRRKWHRVLVSAAGMIVELGIAAIAAVIWARSSEGTLAHAIAYNIMFVASVSTVLFNGNPLLRYDGYYILSDILEIPNLAQRGKQYIYYVVKKYVWGVRKPHNPGHSSGEKAWLVVYAIASMIYRVFISVAILLFVADKLFILGAILAIAAVIAWVFVPIGKFIHYLVSDGELMRVRGRAVLTTLVFVATVVGLVGMIPLPDRSRVEGIVEPDRLAVIHAGADGFLTDFLRTDHKVEAGGAPLFEGANRELDAQLAQLEAERRSAVARFGLHWGKRELAQAQIAQEEIGAVDDQIQHVREQIAALQVKSPIAGEWVSPDIERSKGAYLHRGDRSGLVASLDVLVIRATAGQDVAARLIADVAPRVEIRVQGAPDQQAGGEICRILPAGQERLPSAALGFQAGGSMEVEADDKQGTRAAERFFEIEVTPQTDGHLRLLPGQRVIVRFEMTKKPLVLQAKRWLLQLIQRRYHI